VLSPGGADKDAAAPGPEPSVATPAATEPATESSTGCAAAVGPEDQDSGRAVDGGVSEVSGSPRMPEGSEPADSGEARVAGEEGVVHRVSTSPTQTPGPASTLATGSEAARAGSEVGSARGRGEQVPHTHHHHRHHGSHSAFASMMSKKHSGDHHKHHVKTPRSGRRHEQDDADHRAGDPEAVLPASSAVPGAPERHLGGLSPESLSTVDVIAPMVPHGPVAEVAEAEPTPAPEAAAAAEVAEAAPSHAPADAFQGAVAVDELHPGHGPHHGSRGRAEPKHHSHHAHHKKEHSAAWTLMHWSPRTHHTSPRPSSGGHGEEPGQGHHHHHHHQHHHASHLAFASMSQKHSSGHHHHDHHASTPRTGRSHTGDGHAAAHVAPDHAAHVGPHHVARPVVQDVSEKVPPVLVAPGSRTVALPSKSKALPAQPPAPASPASPPPGQRTSAPSQAADAANGRCAIYYEETKVADGSVVRRNPAVKRRLSNRGRQAEPMVCVQVRSASNPPTAPVADDTFDTVDSPPRLAAPLTYDNLRMLHAGTPTAGRLDASASSTISAGADKIPSHEERLAAALSRCNNRAWPSTETGGLGKRRSVQDRLDSAIRRVRTPPSLRVDPLPPKGAKRMLEKHA